MREFKDKHYMVKVGQMYVSDFGRESFELVSETFKRKANRFEDDLVVDVVIRLKSFGLEPSLIRVDEVTTITETEIGTLEIVSE